MHIIVCAKQIRHTYARTGRSPESHYIDPEDSIYRIDPHDEAALELALRLKDKNDTTTVTLVTIGPLIAPEGLKRCLAAGADDLVQIITDGQTPPDGHTPGSDPLDQPDPWVKSTLLARIATELDGEVVLCGKESLDKGNGQVGALLAKQLDRPFVSAITDLIDGATDGLLHVQRSAGRGVREIIQCPAPAVFSVALGIDLRFPKFSQRQWAESYKPRQLNYGLDAGGSKTLCTHRFQPRPRPKIVVPPPDSRLPAYERVMQLLTGSTVEKKGELLTGTPESQVEGIMAFLKTNGFIKAKRDSDQGSESAAP